MATASRRPVTVWLIEDHIPVAKLGDEILEQVVSEAVPIRVDLLKEALDKFPHGSAPWEEPEVRDLVKQLVARRDVQVTAFLHPGWAIEYLQQGMSAPDLVIFDWEYAAAGNRAEELSQILSSGFSFLCVYTHMGSGEVEKAVQPIREQFGSQFLGVRIKREVSADKLLEEIQKAMDGSMAASLAAGLRRATDEAIGLTLRQFAAIPDKFWLGPEGADAEDLQEGLAGALAGNIGEGVHGTAKLLPAETEVAAAVAGVTTRMVEETVIESNLLKHAISGLAAKNKPADAADLRALQAFQLYTKRRADRVQRGDVMSVGGQFVLVLTAPCDLTRFSSKTRNTLTYVQLTEVDAAGWKEVTNGLPKRADGLPNVKQGQVQIGSSLSSPANVKTELFMLPSVPTGTSEFKDFYVLPHRVSFWSINQEICGYAPEEPLRYEHLEKQYPGVRYVATLADPYATAFMWALARAIFGPGTNDFLVNERERVNRLLQGFTVN